MSSSATSTPVPGQTGTPTTTRGIITTTFSTAWATWTAVIDLDHSTTIALYEGGTTVTQNQTPFPTNTRPPRPRPSSSGPPGPAPSSLYLLTFAITLSLLLTISLAILLRNLVQRTRERRIREAVAAGLIPPESLNYIYRAQFGLHGLGRWGSNGGAAAVAARHGPRPILWDSWLADDGAEKGFNRRSEKDATAWASVNPLSIAPLTNETLAPTQAVPVPPPRPRRTFVETIFHLPPMPYIPTSPPPGQSPAVGPGAGSGTEDAAEQEHARQEHMIAELFREPTAPASPSIPANPIASSRQTNPSAGVRVALYVAMPRDPRRAQTRQTGANNEDAGLEDVDVVLGTSDIRWDQPHALSTTTSPSTSRSVGQL